MTQKNEQILRRFAEFNISVETEEGGACYYDAEDKLDAIINGDEHIKSVSFDVHYDDILYSGISSYVRIDTTNDTLYDDIKRVYDNIDEFDFDESVEIAREDVEHFVDNQFEDFNWKYDEFDESIDDMVEDFKTQFTNSLEELLEGI